ncbi:hypothetical protein Y032_0498g2528 [Ancylostoma ceylanicum]|uniref:Uncharacterized protein n=1 Tax=Ancylostoma ceylanicum TaxID=53326 RepID=A0A016WUJ7_9BILA|nr:hypothetical protein Y032_0498g2528 [Ancylostoma ceylanicum]
MALSKLGIRCPVISFFVCAIQPKPFCCEISLTGVFIPTIVKKKRLVRRPRGYKMDVDPQPSTSQSKPDSRMDWDGAESCISSTSESDGGNCAADADDEQSDWVGYAPSVTEGDFDPMEERRARRLQQKLQMSQLQRRLERFALEGGRGEMGIEFRIKDRPNSMQVVCFE